MLWPGRDARIEPLSGGITNRNFKVEVDGETYALRIGGRDTELLGIDRGHETEATAAAADVGVAPEVLRYQRLPRDALHRGRPGRIESVEEVGRLLAPILTTPRGSGAARPAPGRRGATGDRRDRARRRVPPVDEPAHETVRTIESLAAA